MFAAIALVTGLAWWDERREADAALVGFQSEQARLAGSVPGIVAASAARERDREKRATARLVLGVAVAAGLVLAFGGVALRRQRQRFDAQRELAVAQAQHERDEHLSRAERMATVGTLAMGIAHEVATPLGVIVGRAEQLLGKLQGDERSASGVRAILAQADRIQQVMRRFLDMARGAPPSLDRVDPATVVRAAAAAVEHRFARARVSLDADVPPSMPAIQCDRDLLEQAIVNVLLNACEACAEGGHVEMAARVDAEQVALVVRDDGAGISVENARRASEPFLTGKPGGGGSGMGLAIASEIVKCHRGGLTIEPHPERGTRALIEIPIARGT
jgi:signal transduction histidine kinase